jgi:two-component system sensor histidine kinase/response regulator
MEQSASDEKKLTVLLVDDTKENINVLRKTLDPEGYNLGVALNGEKALELVTKLRPDLILLDIMMPGIDGFETCRRIKENPETKDIAIIFITAKNETEDIVKGFSLGAVDYINKPFRQEEVLSRVRNHINLVRLNRKILKQNDELKELNDIKNKFLNVTTHDLRGSLTTINGYLDLFLLDGMEISPQEGKELISLMKESSDGMLHLVNNLLDVATVESGEINLVLQANPIFTLLKQKLEVQKIVAKKKEIEVNANLEDVGNAIFDSQRVIQVFDNLVSNAIKYSDNNSKILVSLIGGNGFAKVSVKDSGPGISESELENIFSAFSNKRRRNGNNQNGSGLSLLISKKIIEAHKGKLTVESSENSGTEFSFTVPLASI